MDRPFNKDVDPWFWLLYLFMGIAWLGAVISDANNERIGWLIVNIVVPPVGILRGIGNLFP